MNEQIENIKKEAISELEKVNTLKEFDEAFIKFLGKKSELSSILKTLGSLSEEEKKIQGPILNSFKEEINNLFEEKKKEIEKKEIEAQIIMETIDPTIDLDNIEVGHLHPLSSVRYQLEDIFKSMGFMIYDGPEIESEFFNFEALNIPKYHPARDMQDTFYIDSNTVLRTHTSNCEVRALKEFGVPLKMIVPGRVFRNEATDAAHEHTLHQIECLVVDRNISVANLINTIQIFVKILFGDDVKVRIRPSFFPFVEPGLELDISCLICKGRKCPACKNTGWIELGGAGMTHPEVLKAGGINPDEYSGFAFGFGIDRMAMQKYKIEDIRWLMSGDLRFIGQF